jgi:hypothetical protein
VVKRKTANETLDETDDMDEEDVIETFVEQAKERLERLGEKYPGIVIPEDEEIRRMVVLRLCRGLSVNEISKRLHRDNRVVNAAVSRIPRRVDYSFPIEDWEKEVAKEEGRRRVSPEEASGARYERRCEASKTPYRPEQEVQGDFGSMYGNMLAQQFYLSLQPFIRQAYSSLLFSIQQSLLLLSSLSQPVQQKPTSSEDPIEDLENFYKELLKIKIFVDTVNSPVSIRSTSPPHVEKEIERSVKLIRELERALSNVSS